MEKYGTLYVVPTPIGNLKDITLRALEVLNEVDIIACEDTRHTNILLNHYEIKKPSFSLHKFNEQKAKDKVISLIKQGKNVALVSDAGTPLFSDPGAILIKEMIAQNLNYQVLPGANAMVTALVGCGLDCSKCAFLGFLPEQIKQRNTLLEQYKNLDATLCFYVSSHDIQKDLQSLFQNLGSRKVVVANELTKKFEKYISGVLGELIIEEPKGEYVVLVEGVKPTSPLCDLSVEEHMGFYLNQGFSNMDAIKKVAQDRKVAKSEIYKQVVTK